MIKLKLCNQAQRPATGIAARRAALGRLTFRVVRTSTAVTRMVYRSLIKMPRADATEGNYIIT